MILTDTSVWADHLKEPVSTLNILLEEDLVLGHALVTGELSMARFPNRELTLITLQDLPQCVKADDDEVVQFVTENRLEGLGLSYIDAHLLVSALLTPGTMLWTRDKLLRKTAESLGIAAKHLR